MFRIKYKRGLLTCPIEWEQRDVESPYLEIDGGLLCFKDKTHTSARVQDIVKVTAFGVEVPFWVILRNASLNSASL